MVVVFIVFMIHFPGCFQLHNFSLADKLVKEKLNTSG